MLVLVATSLLTSAACTDAALASRNQVNYFEGSFVLLKRNTRPRAMAQLVHLGVKALRVELYWELVAPRANSAARPRFEAMNPGRYPWGEYDALIGEALRRHWKILLTITTPAPRWATANRRAPYVTRPDARDFQEFMTAVGRHYGSLVTYSILNEPNHPAFLMPQWNRNGTPASPRIYRGLYQAAYTGLQAAGLAHPPILFGETAPVGYGRVNVRREKGRALLHPVAPLAFLRGALCLNPHYRKSGSCGPLQMIGFAHHAYTNAAGPSYRPPEGDNVTIGVLSRLARALDLAARARAIPARVPIYLTEFGVQSFPNRQLGVSVGRQAEYDAIAEHIAWANPRVAAFSQYLLKDDPLGGRPGAGVHGGVVGFQTGLQYVNGRAKPLYFAWPVPLTVSRTRGGVALWGVVRPATGATRLTVLVRPSKRSTRYRTLRVVSTDGSGYWSLRASGRGAAYRVRWTSPGRVVYLGPPIAPR